MKKALPWIIIGIVVALAIIFKPKNKDAADPKAKGNSGPVLVDGRIVKPQPLSNKISVSGTILSNEEVTLQSQVAGIVSHIYFSEGSKVKKGDLLVKIDDSQFQAQLKKDEVAEQLAEITEERQKKLLAINGISQQDYDIALNNLNSIKADMKLIQVQIDYTNIRASFDGIIGLKNISEGSYVSQNTVLVNVEQVTPIKIDFYVPEKYLGQLHKDQIIDFTVTGYSDLFKGKIYALDPKIDENTRTIHIRALSDNKDGRLLPGAFANINITLSQNATALMIPTEAVIPQASGQTAYVMRKGIVSSLPITLGVRTDSTVEVLKGINEGDTVITHGVQLVHPGSLAKFKSVY